MRQDLRFFQAPRLVSAAVANSAYSKGSYPDSDQLARSLDGYGGDDRPDRDPVEELELRTKLPSSAHMIAAARDLIRADHRPCVTDWSRDLRYSPRIAGSRHWAA